MQNTVKSVVPLSKTIFFVILLLAVLLINAQVSYAYNDSAESRDNGVVIYAYHRIDETESPATNLSFEQFETHINTIIENDYNVITMDDAVEALKKDLKIKPKTIVITFEGGHKSILDKAVPLLLKHDLPFTIFVAVNHVEWNSQRYLDWDEIQSLAKQDGVAIGLHPSSYSSMLDHSIKNIRAQINHAKSRYRELLDSEPKYFAYPFGELSKEIKDIIKDYKFSAGFGQQSGVAHAGSDMFMIPRFAMTDSYGDIDRFQLTANALPLPVSDVIPEDPYISENPPAIGFSIDSTLKNKDSLSCFATAEGETETVRFGKRVEIRLSAPFAQGRARINCTMPAGFNENGQQQWRWFGMLFTVPEDVIDYSQNTDDKE